MATSPRDLRYTNVAIILHWAIAALILYNLASGLLRPLLPPGFFRFHVSSGITILLLSLVRVVWRLTHWPPPMLAMKPWERSLAHLVHGLLYAAILIVPFSGWALVSAKPPAGSPGAAWSAMHPPASHEPAPIAKRATPSRPRGPTMFWGMVRLPLLSPVTSVGYEARNVPAQRAMRGRIETFHMLAAWMMLALLLLHVAGALKHQFIDRQRQLARMGVS